MKIRHLIAILFFVVLIVAGSIYANSKDRAEGVKLEDTYPENVLDAYYKKLSTRDGGSVDEVLMPPSKYKTWILYDRLNSKKARITGKMFKNLKDMKIKSIEKIKVKEDLVEFPRKNNKVDVFSPEDTCIFKVKYNIEYFRTDDKTAMYSEFYNKTYKDTKRNKQTDQVEKVWLVKIDDGSWKIAKFAQKNSI